MRSVSISARLFAVAAMFCATGCAVSGGPVVVGRRHLGVGWFVQRRPIICQPPSARPACIDVEGVGVLFTPGRCSIGYAKDNYVALPPGTPDAHVHLSRMELFTGRFADDHARRWMNHSPFVSAAAVPPQESER